MIQFETYTKKRFGSLQDQLIGASGGMVNPLADARHALGEFREILAFEITKVRHSLNVQPDDPDQRQAAMSSLTTLDDLLASRIEDLQTFDLEITIDQISNILPME